MSLLKTPAFVAADRTGNRLCFLGSSLLPNREMLLRKASSVLDFYEVGGRCVLTAPSPQGSCERPALVNTLQGVSCKWHTCTTNSTVQTSF